MNEFGESFPSETLHPTGSRTDGTALEEENENDRIIENSINFEIIDGPDSENIRGTEIQIENVLCEKNKKKEYNQNEKQKWK